MTRVRAARSPVILGRARYIPVLFLTPTEILCRRFAMMTTKERRHPI